MGGLREIKGQELELLEKNAEGETFCTGSVPGRKTCKKSGEIQDSGKEKEELKEREP